MLKFFIEPPSIVTTGQVASLELSHLFLSCPSQVLSQNRPEHHHISLSWSNNLNTILSADVSLLWMEN